MQIQTKAIQSKPQVGLNVAVGKLTLTADDLADAAMLTAIHRVFFGSGGDPSLRKAIGHAAVKVAYEMRQHEPEFIMQTRKRGNGSN